MYHNYSHMQTYTFVCSQIVINSAEWTGANCKVNKLGQGSKLLTGFEPRMLLLNLILHLPCHSKSTSIALRWAVKTNRTADGTWNQLCLCVERLLKMSFLLNFVLLKIAANRIHEMNTCANVTCEKVCSQILIISPNQAHHKINKTFWDQCRITHTLQSNL